MTNDKDAVANNRREQLRLWFENRTLPEKEKSYISQLIGGKASFGEKAARRLEKTYGMGDKYLEASASNPNTEPAPDIKGNVPLISWVQAGAMCAIVENFSQSDAEDWLPCPVKHSLRTYVLRVRGSSMYNPQGERSFRDGDLIFIDPERAYIHKSLVVVRLDNSNEATFKQLIIEGETSYLQALNPSWPEPIIKINNNATICGVVIFKGEVM